MNRCKKRNLDRPGIVYMAVCTVNGKRYIGVTSTTLKERMAQHKHKIFEFYYEGSFKRNHAFAKEVRLHGWKNFYFFIIEKCSNMRFCLRREAELIRDLKPELNTKMGEYKFCAVGSSEKPNQEDHEKPDRRIRAKPIKCLTDGRVFGSKSEAAKYYYGVSVSAKGQNLCGTLPEVHGRRFRYLS